MTALPANNVPERLLVSSPLYAEHCSGTFHLLSEQVNHYPIWESADHRHWLFSTRAGGWMVSDDKASVHAQASSGLIASVGKHRGQMPHKIAQWQVGDGAGWHADSSIAVALVPQFSPRRTQCVDSPTTEHSTTSHPTSALSPAAAERLRISSTQIDTLLSQCDTLRSDKRDLQTKYADTEKDLRLLLLQNEALQRRLDESENAGQSARSVVTQKRELETQVGFLGAQLSRVEHALAGERQEKALLEAESNRVRSVLQGCEAELGTLGEISATLVSTQTQLAKESEVCEALRTENAALHNNIVAVEQQTDPRLEELERENAALRRELDELRPVPLMLADSERELRTTLQRLTASEHEVVLLKRAQLEGRALPLPEEETVLVHPLPRNIDSPPPSNINNNVSLALTPPPPISFPEVNAGIVAMQMEGQGGGGQNVQNSQNLQNLQHIRSMPAPGRYAVPVVPSSSSSVVAALPTSPSHTAHREAVVRIDPMVEVLPTPPPLPTQTKHYSPERGRNLHHEMVIAAAKNPLMAHHAAPLSPRGGAHHSIQLLPIEPKRKEAKATRHHSPPAPPDTCDRMWVISPGIKQMEGLYHVQDPTAPTPTWTSGQDRWLIVNIDGIGEMRWYLTCGDGEGFATALARIKEGGALARSEPCVSLAAMPHSLKLWEHNIHGTWVYDPSIRVTHTGGLGVE